MKKIFQILAVALCLQLSLLGQTTYTSTATGNWSTMTWDPAGTPGSLDAVIIADGHTVTFNQDSIIIASLTIGQGTSGILQYENVASPTRILVVTGDLTIADGAQFNHGLTVNAEHRFYLGGNLSIGNAAKLAIIQASSRGIQFNFNKATSGDQTITSTGTPTLIDFHKVLVLRGSSSDRVVSNITGSIRGGNLGLQIVTGVFEQTTGTLTMPSAVTGAGANWYHGSVNGTFKASGDASVIFTSGVQDVSGGMKGTLIINTSGTITIGAVGTTIAGNTKLENAGTVNIQSGTVNINGRFFTNGGTTTISGGTVNIDPQVTANTAAGTHTFEVNGTGTLNMSGGTVNIVDPNATTGTGIDVRIYGTTNFSGGTISLGNGISSSSGSADGFEVYLGSSANAFYNLVVNNPTGSNRHVMLTDHTTKRDLFLNNGLTISGGELRAYGPDAASSNITMAGNWTNNGTFSAGSTSTVTLNGSSAQSVGGSTVTTFSNLTLNNAAGAAFGSDATVNGTLTLTSGDISTGANTITLGASGTLSETEGNTIVGNITTTRSVSQAVNNSFGGIGIEINAADAAPGSTSVTRITGIAPTGGGNEGIERYFDIVPTVNTGLNATLVFRYDESELNSIPEANLVLFKSTDAGSTWTLSGGTVNTGSNNITQTGISSFSRWATANSSAPLPVELVSFTAVAKRAGVELRWSTATELNNHGFEIQRSVISNQQSDADGRTLNAENRLWNTIGFIDGNGTSNNSHEYMFVDHSLTAGTYAFRLKQIDRDGAFAYSGTVEAIVAPAPTVLALTGNYPNPFNPSTTISFTVPSEGRAVLKIFDVLGKEIAMIFNDAVSSGTAYDVPFNASSLPSGIYFSQLEFAGQRMTKKMLLMK